MRLWWENLTKKEQIYLVVGALAVIIYISYLIIFLPITNSVKQKESSLKEKEITLGWLEAHKKMSVRKQNPVIINENQLLTIIEKQLNQGKLKDFEHGLNLTNQLEIELKLANVPYQETLFWLWKLSTQYSILVKQCTISPTKTLGKANISISFAIRKN